MNKIYRIIRNSKTGAWAVTSEVSKSNRKSSSTAALLAVTLLGIQAAHAQTVSMPDFDPTTCDGSVCATTVSGGATVTLTGQGTQIVTGKIGLSGSVSLPTLLANGQIISGQQYSAPNNPVSLVVNTGTKSNVVVVADPTTGGTRTVTVYDNANIVDTHADSNTVSGKYMVSTSTAVDGSQYINTRIGQVDSSGGTLNVNIGNGGATDDAANSISMVAKNSSLFYADGTGGNASTVVWQSNNKVDMGSVASAVLSGTSTSTKNFIFSSYIGTFSAFDGSSHSVNSAADLQAYNNFLIAQMQSGALSPTQYDAEFSKAYINTSRPITYANGPADLSDEVYTLIGTRAVIQAVGANATGIVASGVHLDAYQVSTNNGGSAIGAVLLADQGGTIINDGTLSSVRGGSSDSQYAMMARNGSHILNNGVVNAGFFAGQAGKTDPDGSVLILGSNHGLYALGAGSTVVNAGILNEAGPSSIGITLNNSATGSNSGIINMNVGTANISGVGTRSIAVTVGAGSIFTNTASGLIYLGRSAQYDAAASPADTANGSTPLTGIYLTNSTGSATNAGTITLGRLAQNAQGIYVNGAGTVANTGIINVNGAASDAPAENVGIYALNSSKVSNTGTINLNGINSIGIKSITSGGTAKVVSSGTINVAGGVSANGLRNYGIWAEGSNSSIDMTGGAVNLSGDGAIGAHTRSGGKISITGGVVNFQSGTNQIGFFAYGAGSSVDINSAPANGLNASTAKATLLRIENGATINNNAGAKLIASGVGSTALQVTGTGSSANLAGLDITVSGNDAVGVKVEGGATGQMSGTTRLTLRDGTTAVVVDNTKYDISGNATGSAQSSFTNNAQVEVLSAHDVTAFVVKNGAQLANSGDIHLSNGTAIEIVGAGSAVVNNGAAPRGAITVDDGKAGIYVHGGATLNTADKITVNNAASGVLIGADASRVVIEQGAHITGLSSAFGNLITNQSADGNVLVDGATLEMQGSGAALLSESNLDATSHGHIIVSNQNNGKGIALSGAEGSMISSNMTIGPNWLIDVTGNGSGVYSNTTGNLLLDGAQINVSGPGIGVKADAVGNVQINSGTTVTGTNPDAVLVTGNPASLINQGTLTSVNAEATAIKLGDTGTTLANVNGGQITGAVLMGNGNDNVVLENSSLNGELHTGDGSDTVTVRGNAVTYGVIDGGIGASDLDTLIFDSHNYTATAGNADQIRNFEEVKLTGSSTLTLQRDFALGDNNNGIGNLFVDTGSTLKAIDGPVSVVGNLTHAGLVTLAHGSATHQLTVTGSYTAQGGTLALDTVLNEGGANSQSDKLVVGSTQLGSAPTNILVNNVGGIGANTVANGIELVHVNNAAQSANGVFKLANRVAAGAYEYDLYHGSTSGAADGNWYLRTLGAPTPTPDPDPTPNPDPQPNPQPQPNPSPRPETGVYLTNMAAAAGMFMHTLHDRLGEPQYTEASKQEEQGKVSAVWARVVGSHSDGKAADGRIDTRSDTSLIHLGGDIARWRDDNDSQRYHLGLMGAAGNARTHADSTDINITNSGYQRNASGTVDGYSIGVYGTWYQHDPKDNAFPRGPYVDTWLQYGWYNNTVQGNQMTQEKYDSNGLLASIEGGWAFVMSENKATQWMIEPQAQIAYSLFNQDSHQEGNGTQVGSGTNNGYITRLGARLYTRDLRQTNGLQPFVEANWWHSNIHSKLDFNGVTVDDGTPGNRYEIKVGMQGEFAKRWQIWSHVGIQMGQDEYRHYEGQIGIKHLF